MPPRINQAARQQLDWNFDPSGLGDLFSSYVPEPVKRVASSAWNQIPKPVQKAAKFGFESLLPDPNELLDPSYLINPAVGTALNVPKRSLKMMKESLIDTLPSYFNDSKLAGIAKDLLHNTKMAGYLGGEGQVSMVHPAANKQMKDYGLAAAYRPMFDSQDAKNEFSENMYNLSDAPHTASAYMRDWRKKFSGNKPTISVKEMSEGNFVDSLVHELTHLGQDVAPQGSAVKGMNLRQEYAKQNPGKNLPYSLQLPEITVRSHPRVNPVIGELEEQAGGAKLDKIDRIIQGISSLGTFNFLQNASPADVKFYEDFIRPALAGYGHFDPKYAAVKLPRRKPTP